MGGRQDSLAAHAGPAHPPESPHVRSGPSSRGREPEEEAEGAGLALWLAAEVCSGSRVPGELEVRATGAGVRSQPSGHAWGCSDLGPGEGRDRGGGRERAPEGALLSLGPGLLGPCREFGKSFRMDCCGDPLPPLQLAGPPALRHPLPSPLASRAVPALPRPAGRARRRADYISPGLAGLVFPEPRLREPGDPGDQRRPSPPPALRKEGDL